MRGDSSVAVDSSVKVDTSVAVDSAVKVDSSVTVDSPVTVESPVAVESNGSANGVSHAAEASELLPEPEPMRSQFSAGLERPDKPN